MKQVVVVGLVALGLAGCAGPKPIAEMSYSEQQALVQQLAQRCTDQGFGPDNPQHMACVNHEARREFITRQNDQARRERVADALAETGAGIGNSMQQNAAINRPINCTSTPNSSWVGGPVRSVSTNCY